MGNMLMWFLNEKEINLITLSEKDNNEELINWKIPNLLTPLTIIAISLFAYLLLIPVELKNNKDFFNLLLNGSIPLVAFTRVSSALSYLAKVDFKESEKLGVSLKNLRQKIYNFILSLVAFVIVFYCFQVIYRPFELSFYTFIQFVFSVLLFWASIGTTKATFLLQESLLMNTYLISFKEKQDSLKNTPKDDEIHF